MNKKEAGIWLLLSLVIFIGMYLMVGLQLGGDYGQYVDMHINREPVYPLYLAIFRWISGENYLKIAVLVQSIIMSLSITYFLMKISELFQFHLFFKATAFGILIAPHIITPLFSQSHLVITNGIMSEALAIPLFLLFIVEILQYIYLRKNGYTIKALLAAFLLSLIRGQMMPTILIWAVVNIACAIGDIWLKEKPADAAAYLVSPVITNRLTGRNTTKTVRFIKKCLVAGICVLLIFIARTTTVKTYNYLVHGYYINNTYGSVNFAAQVLYVADEEDGQYIQDERARHMYDVIYEKLTEEKANYRYTEGMSLIEKAYYLEDKHDYIKFEAVEPLTRQYLRDLGIDGDEYYIDQNVEIDRIAGEITKAVLPHHMDKWLMNYFAISINGLVRCIAYDKSFLMWYAFVMYVLAIVATIYLYIRNRQSKAVWFMALSILAILANVYATSLTIMCLSRYMIYEFSVFYMAFLCVCKEILELKMGNILQAEK